MLLSVLAYADQSSQKYIPTELTPTYLYVHSHFETSSSIMMYAVLCMKNLKIGFPELRIQTQVIDHGIKKLWADNYDNLAIRWIQNRRE